jgi:hypothetical protein
MAPAIDLKRYNASRFDFSVVLKYCKVRKQTFRVAAVTTWCGAKGSFSAVIHGRQRLFTAKH